jgi:succinoglycan biosynthesis protein ExoO
MRPIVAPRVSVIMANHNGRRYLASAIRSLVKQTMTAWELLFVDDASTDDSVALAHETANGDPRIKITPLHDNRGPGAARNQALNVARGEWVAIFDSDDLMDPRRLGTLLARAEGDRAAIVADNLLLFSEAMSTPRLYLKNGRGETPSWIGLADLIKSNCLYSRMPDLGYLKPMIRTELLVKTGLRYDERLRIGEDYYFLASLLVKGRKLRIEPSALYLYRKHEGSISHRMDAAHIHALLDADERFKTSVTLTRRERRCIDRRRRSLEALLVYDGVVRAIKQGRAASGARLAVRNPLIWPLLTRPIAARLKRVRQAFGAL